MELFPISDEEKSEISKRFPHSIDQIAQDVGMLEEWIRKQPHLPQQFAYEHFLAKMLANCKFSVERSKQKIEKLCLLKTQNKDLFEVFQGPDFVLPSQNSLTVLPLPRLGPNMERIYVMNAKSVDSDLFEFAHLIQITISVSELMLKYDPSNSIRAVIDAQNCTFGQIKKMNLAKFAGLATLLIQGYACKITGIDFVNVQPAMQVLITVLKKIMKVKVLERLKIHSTLESLYESLDAQYLPEEYGGTNGNISKIIVKMDDLVEKSKTFLIDCQNYTVDESLMVDPYNNNVPLTGTFRKLNVD